MYSEAYPDFRYSLIRRYAPRLNRVNNLEIQETQVQLLRARKRADPVGKIEKRQREREEVECRCRLNEGERERERERWQLGTGRCTS